jgi:hypothetical protein
VSDDALHDAAAGEYGEKDSPYAALAEELYRERVLRARRTPPEQKLLAGEELFEYACSITMAGIRNQFPEASEGECREILRQRLALRERMEEKK